MSFDLEKAIAAWRRPYEVNQAFSAEDIEELEGSLRDRVEALVAKGIPEKDAYHRARRRMGAYGAAETEYGKVYWGKLKRERRLGTELIWRLTMFKNYFTVTLRTLGKQKGYAFINIFGLAIGLASFVVIMLYVQDERSYDQFHENADRIYMNPAASFRGLRRISPRERSCAAQGLTGPPSGVKNPSRVIER